MFLVCLTTLFKIHNLYIAEFRMIMSDNFVRMQKEVVVEYLKNLHWVTE
jgi:hypothetical protein